MSSRKRPKVDQQVILQSNKFDKVSGRADNALPTSFIASGRLWDHIGRYLPYILILTAILTGFCYVYAYGVNILWEDEWDLIPPLLQKFDAGTLTLADFWKPHSEHRIFFPTLIDFGLGFLTAGDIVMNMYLSQLVLAGALVLFVSVFRERFAEGPGIWLMVPLAFLCFSFRQWQNMLFGVQLQCYLVILAQAGAFFCLGRMKDGRFMSMFICAALFATLASGSFISGLLVWPVALGQILLLPLERRRKGILMAVWAILSILEWIVYFIGYTKPSYHPPYGWSWAYFFEFVGGGLFDQPATALIAGVIVLVLMAVAVAFVFLKRQWAEQSFWLAILAFGLANVGVTVIGRAGFGANQALSSRYATFSIPLIIATGVLLAPRRGEKFFLSGVLLTGAMAGLAILGTGQAFITGMGIGEAHREFRRYAQAAVCTMDSQPDEMICVINNYHISGKRDVLLGYVDTVKKLKYNVFADEELYARSQVASPTLPVLPAAPRCEITGIAPSPMGPLTIIRGWAVDWPRGNVAGGVTVVLDGVAYPACYGLPSDESVKKLGDGKFANAGFGCAVPARELGRGQHTISLKVLTRDRTGVYVTPNPLTFEIK